MLWQAGNKREVKRIKNKWDASLLRIKKATKFLLPAFLRMSSRNSSTDRAENLIESQSKSFTSCVAFLSSISLYLAYSVYLVLSLSCVVLFFTKNAECVCVLENVLVSFELFTSAFLPSICMLCVISQGGNSS